MLIKNNIKQQLSFSYDDKHDILYISIGEPKECYSEEILSGVFLRKEFDNDEINGLTILNLKHRSQMDKNTIAHLPLFLEVFNVDELSAYF